MKFMTTVEIVPVTYLTNPIAQKKRESGTNKTHMKDWSSTGNYNKLSRNPNSEKRLKMTKKY